MSNFKQSIVITTINPPTKAIGLFARRIEWQKVVVGDRKTPDPWFYPDVIYLSPKAQAAQGFRLCERLPWNHYCRKMIGYLHCIRAGAEVIFDTDDDNLPKDDWSVPLFDGVYACSPNGTTWVNIYRSFTNQRIWPRGFPLELLTSANTVLDGDALSAAPVRVGVWQSLADGDPDVDAIYRLTDSTPCYFRNREPIVLGVGSVCPFNSQVTAFRRELFPLLYLPATVTFRFTDILRGLVAQPIMWAAGYLLGFTRATVVQERNPHNYLKDFESEIPCYLHAQTVLDVATGAVNASAPVGENLAAVYEALYRRGLVRQEELVLLEAWLEDLERP
jgi:hypothetical protein